MLAQSVHPIGSAVGFLSQHNIHDKIIGKVMNRELCLKIITLLNDKL